MPRSLAAWAFVFLWLGCASIAAIFFFGMLAGTHLIDNDTAEGVAMAVGFVIAPLCFVIAIALGAWHLWRKLTGAGQPPIGLGLAAKPPGDALGKR